MGEEKLTESKTTVATAEIALPGFSIDAAEASRMASDAGVESVEDLLPLLVPSAMRLARAPISNFPVGAVGLGDTGRVYVGVNLEFLGLPLSHSVHAEQCLIANAAANAERSIRSLAVSHMPCGHCRQFLQEIRMASDIRIHVVSESGTNASYFRPLASLLPLPFGPLDLLHKDHPLLLEPHDNPVDNVIDKGNEAVACNGFDQVDQKLKEAATQAAREAHAPYSGCASGFAVADVEGRVYAGSYVESAAYNPSLGPVQAAIIAMVVSGAGGADEVAAAALVEREKAVVGQEGTARIFLEAVAPAARLRVYHYQPSD